MAAFMLSRVLLHAMTKVKVLDELASIVIPFHPTVEVRFPSVAAPSTEFGALIRS